MSDVTAVTGVITRWRGSYNEKREACLQGLNGAVVLYYCLINYRPIHHVITFHVSGHDYGLKL